MEEEITKHFGNHSSMTGAAKALVGVKQKDEAALAGRVSTFSKSRIFKVREEERPSSSGAVG